MIQDTLNKNHYIAESGKIIIHKDDTFDDETKTYHTATTSIWLGRNYSIANYKEVIEK